MIKNTQNYYKSSKLMTFMIAFMGLLFSYTNVGATQSAPYANGVIASPGVELWKAVRQRNGENLGRSQIKNKDSATLINSAGESWRQLRVNQIIPYSNILLLMTILIIAAFRLIRGKIKIEAGRSGKKILRFTYHQRVVHWVTAILFVLLAFTGTVILLGRTLLLPYLGSDVFGALAAFSKTVHDYTGPIFSIAMVFMFFSYVKGNFFKLKDMEWFKNGGGMFGKHASAGRYNAGEKSWFWVLFIGGLVIILSGLVLDFPIFNLDRSGLSLAQIIHVIAAVLLLAASLGHVFMGTIAMEGAYETMTTGYCDENWAKEHHDEWYAEHINDVTENPQDVKEANSTSPQVSTAQ